MSRGSGARPGIALLVTLLGILALELVIAGVMHVALQQNRIAVAGARGLALEAAARAAAAEALEEWTESRPDTFPLDTLSRELASVAAGAVTARAHVRRVTPDLFLVRAEAEGAAGERRAIAVLLRQLSEPQFLARVRAAAVAARVLGTGELSGTPPAGCPIPDGAPAAVPPLALLDTGAAPGALLLAPDSMPTFGRFAGPDLRRARPAPPSFQVLTGDTIIAAAAGPSVLVVDGSVTIGQSGRFRGLLLVSGSVVLLPGAELTGAVIAGAALRIAGGRVQYDPCVLVELFRTVPALRGPLRAAPHWWIPAA